MEIKERFIKCVSSGMMISRGKLYEGAVRIKVEETGQEIDGMAVCEGSEDMWLQRIIAPGLQTVMFPTMVDAFDRENGKKLFRKQFYSNRENELLEM